MASGNPDKTSKEDLIELFESRDNEVPENEDNDHKSDSGEELLFEDSDSSVTEVIQKAIEEHDRPKGEEGAPPPPLKPLFPSNFSIDDEEEDGEGSERNEQDAEESDSDEKGLLDAFAQVSAKEPPPGRTYEDGRKSSLVDLLEGWVNDLYADDHCWQDVLESNERSPGETSRGISKEDDPAVKFTDSDAPSRGLYPEKWANPGEVYVERKIEVTTTRRNCPEHGEEEVEEIRRQATLRVNLDGQDSLEGFLPDVDFIDFRESDDE